MVRFRRAGLLVGFLAVAGCAQNSTGSTASGAVVPGAMTGETTPKRAVESFMRAVNDQDLQQMGTLWGTTQGAARDRMARDVLEKRLIVIQCMLAHDSWGYAESTPHMLAGGRQEFLVEVRKKRLRAKTTVTTVQGPRERWYVEIIDVQPLRDFCN